MLNETGEKILTEIDKLIKLNQDIASMHAVQFAKKQRSDKKSGEVDLELFDGAETRIEAYKKAREIVINHCQR